MISFTWKRNWQNVTEKKKRENWHCIIIFLWGEGTLNEKDTEVQSYKLISQHVKYMHDHIHWYKWNTSYVSNVNVCNSIFLCLFSLFLTRWKFLYSFMVTMRFDDIVLLLVLYSFHYEIYPFTILFEFTFQAEDLQREK